MDNLKFRIINKLPLIEFQRGINIVYLDSSVYEAGKNYYLKVEIITHDQFFLVERVIFFSDLGEDVKGVNITNEDIYKHLKQRL